MMKIPFVILVIIGVGRALGFNLASKFPKVINDPLRRSTSYFGYTVQLLDSLRPDTFRLVVGAPKSESVHHPNLESPGAVYECFLNEEEGRCLQIKLEQSGERKYPDQNGYEYTDLKKNAWIGGALTVNRDSGYITVCGPRWKNQNHKDYYLMNGVCYLLPSIDRNDVSDIKKLLPLLYQGNQGYRFNASSEDGNTKGSNEVFFYSYGEAGISVDAFDNEIIVGAPGVFNWKGTIIRYKITESYDNRQFLHNGFTPNPYFTREIPLDGYMGYSVGHGKFFQDKEKSYVASAPRAGRYRGKVFVFKMPETTEEPLLIEIQLEGRQMGEYFGASLCVADLNKDGFDDLLVGAPQHSKNDGEISSDQGKVYVFINDQKGNLPELEIDLMGSKTSGSRFGTVISVIGDLDHDGYPEIAVGAPYEKDSASRNDNSGAIYIYKGTSRGIAEKYSQKISSSDLGLGIKGFGIDISKGLDIDGNHYNDIAVGAYESGQVILIKTSPVARFFHSVTADIAYIQQNTTQFRLTICLKYEGYHLPKTLDVDLSITLDKILKRAHFETRTNSIKYRSVLVEKSDNCETRTVFFEPSKVSLLKNRYAALPIALNYSLATRESQEFCKTCPVTDPSSDTYYFAKLPVMSKCEKITACIPDWKISSEFSGIKIPFVIGSKDHVYLRIRIKNRGDSSTLEHFIVTLPESFPLKITPAKCNKMSTDSWKCLSDVIVPSEQEEILDLVLDASKIEIGPGSVTFRFALSSLDEESEKVEKNFTLELPMKEESRIEISAKAKPDVYVETPESKKSVSLIHSFHVHNLGFTRLKNFLFRCLVPETISWKSTIRRIAETPQLTATLNSEPIRCDRISAPSSNLNASRSNSEADEVLSLDCTFPGVKCIAYDCQVAVLDSYSNGIHVEIKIPILLDAIKPFFEESFSLHYTTSFTMLNGEGLVKSASTRFEGASIPEKTDPWFWFYVASAILFGAIILSVIIFLLYRRKFFERSRFQTGDDQGNLITEMPVSETEESPP